mmetsp:Transcript_20471/g.15095  ORF Transcript_20471/g.15095 Transcript_20471/m.15095 type:complete len:762 (+) Transcript_20471:47-2332(+)
MIRHFQRAVQSTQLLSLGRRKLFPTKVAEFSSVTGKEVCLRVIFGSQTGTAEAFANELEFDAQELSINAEVVDALNFRAKQLLPTNGKKYVNAFVVAVYGEGEPTDNAKKFFKSLDEIEGLSGVPYAVFGLGNAQCFHDRYNVIGKRLDKQLESLGAKRIHALGLGDASASGSEAMGEKFAMWKKGLLDKIQAMTKEADTPDTPLVTSDMATPPAISNIIASKSSDVLSASNPELENSGNVPISLSPRQRAMVPSNYSILQSTVSHVTQLFTKTDEMTVAVEAEFDLSRTSPLYQTDHGVVDVNSLTNGLQPGDHVGVFAPNSEYVVNRFALAAGLSNSDLNRSMSFFNNEKVPESMCNADIPTLKQVLTWQTHLSGVASITSIKLLQRWMREIAQENRLVLTAKLFSQLESKYDSLVKEKGLDISSVLDMIPKLPGLSLPISALLKTLPTLNPRLYSITHMLLPTDAALASIVVEQHCPISQQTRLAPLRHTPTAPEDMTKVTLLCRLLRYRQTKSSANRVVDGVCSSYLCERLVPNESKVALFFRQSNFHMPTPTPISTTNAVPPTVIMIAGGSGLAPFLSFLETRQRWLARNDIHIGPAFLYFGCRTNDEYIFRDKLVSYLEKFSNHPSAPLVQNDFIHKNQPTLDRLVVSFSQHTPDGEITPTPTESFHDNEILIPREEHIPTIFLEDRKSYLTHLQQGGVIYVCGGAGQFGKAVREAVNIVAMESFGMTAASTEGIVHPGIRRLIEEKRYFEDLAD